MSEDVTDPATARPPLSADRWTARIRWARMSGLALAFVGVVDGLVMALDRTEADCPNGKIFPESATDFTCYAHPQAPEGVAIAAISLMLGILIVLAAWIATALLVDRTRQF